tara:strand:+ start:132 stop:407 length:276 start_codon:yes stop_codon:yes gene_type:complete
MISKQTIIYQLYPKAAVIYTDGSSFDVKDKDGKSISIDQSAIDAEFAKQEYKNKRADEYPSVKAQLDDIYHNGIDGWKATIKTTKDKYPKP